MIFSFYVQRSNGASSEGKFCYDHSLNNSVLRMTSDAKMQLKNLLCDVGFPQECLHPMPFRYRQEDENLDLVSVINDSELSEIKIICLDICLRLLVYSL